MSAENPFPEIERVEPDLSVLEAATTEAPFLRIAFDLLREATGYVTIAANIIKDGPTLSRDNAVINGNLVRLWKLLVEILDRTAEHHRETASILSRLMFETIVNTKYIMRNFSPEIIESYIRHSLRHERELRDTIQKNIAARNGIVKPIEDRMLRSIEKAEKYAGISLDSIDTTKRPKAWGDVSLWKKAEQVGLELPYLAVFGGMSHNVHGSWQDLYEYHLEPQEDGTFLPNLNWKQPRPQILNSTSKLVMDLLWAYFEHLKRPDIEEYFCPKLDDLWKRVEQADRAHENWLANK
jgi:hypothetical protein